MSANLVYGYTSFEDLYSRPDGQPSTRLLSPDEKAAYLTTRDWKLALHLMSVVGSVELPSGTAFAVVLPMARVVGTKIAEGDQPVVRTDADGWGLTETVDQGLADAELRVRQEVFGLLGLSGRYLPRLTVAAGLAAPTGRFLGKEGGGGATDTDRYVSLGRGLWWGLLDIDLFGAIHERVGYMLQVATRMPLSSLHGDDGWYFQWGPEARLVAGVNGVLWPGVLHAALAGEWEIRGRGKERLLAGDPIGDFANGGGQTRTVVPTLQAIIGKGFSAGLSARIPLSYEVFGVQPVPGTSVFASLQYAWSPAAPPPSPGLRPGRAPRTELLKTLVVPGKVTIIDYWATWCGPCKKLKPELEAFAETRPDVVLRKVDATEWDAEQMRRHLPAAAGLPVVDIFGRDGKLIIRLVGPECFDFRSRIPAPAP